MARLTARERAKLPDTAFAYVDSRGNRRLPLNDASHVRNALARFDQVAFESDGAREKARQRLLNAARRHGIVPVGFITGQLRSARQQAAAGRLLIELGRIDTMAELQRELRRTLADSTLDLLRWSKEAGSYVGCDGSPVALPGDDSSRTVTYWRGRGRPLTAVVHDPGVLVGDEMTEAVLAAVNLVSGRELEPGADATGPSGERLPDGIVTFLLTDIEDSTGLLTRLGDVYADVLTRVRDLTRTAVLQAGGREVEARADEFVAVFEQPAAALSAAVAVQRGLGENDWPDGHRVRVRAGLHRGDIALTESGYVGITVHTAARVMAAASGGQIVATAETRPTGAGPDGVTFESLGRHHLRGLPDAHELLQVNADGLADVFPPLQT